MPYTRAECEKIDRERERESMEGMRIPCIDRAGAGNV